MVVDDSTPLNSLSKECHRCAVEHGWWDSSRSDLELFMLMTTELAEAAEAYRNNEETYYYDDTGKPCGKLSELADVLIRVFDYCADRGYDLDKAVREKIEYNKTRPYRHGGKRI